MKKLATVFVMLLLVCNLTACTSNQDTKESTSATSSKSSESKKETDASSESSEQKKNEKKTENESNETGKTLVVYYSATGNTKEVADFIAAATNGDTFELKPAEAYSDADLDWTDDNSRVVKEHDNPDIQDVELVETKVSNWDSYDTVFIGYPIWWGIAAWPVNQFVKSNDFTGKTIIPFCTSSSSGLGESGNLLAEMAETGNWIEGERFSSGVSEDEVKEWIERME